MNTFSTNSTNCTKEHSILLHSILYLAQNNNIEINKEILFNEFNKNNIKLHLSTNFKTLRVYTINNKLDVEIPNITVSKLKSTKPIGKLRYCLNNINK